MAIAKNELATNQGFKNLVSTQSLNKNYLYYFLKSAKHLAESAASGTIFLELSGSKFSQLPIPLPPLNKQNRIAIKLEEIFSELDHCNESLKHALPQLKTYRETMLKNAFDGKLTEMWRRENNHEPAVKLLEQINEDHQAKYTQDLKYWKEAVKKWNRNSSFQM